MSLMIQIHCESARPLLSIIVPLRSIAEQLPCGLVYFWSPETRKRGSKLRNGCQSSPWQGSDLWRGSNVSWLYMWVFNYQLLILFHFSFDCFYANSILFFNYNWFVVQFEIRRSDVSCFVLSHNFFGYSWSFMIPCILWILWN